MDDAIETGSPRRETGPDRVAVLLYEGPLAAGVITTPELHWLDYDAADLFLEVSDKGTNTSITLELEAAASIGVDPVAWAPVEAEPDPLDPTATNPYSRTWDVSAVSAPFARSVRFAQRGARGRARITGTAGDGSIKLYASRQVR